MRKTILRYHVLAVSLCLCFFLLGWQPALAVDTSDKVVRVGCLDIESFLELDANGVVHGYAAEYLEKIARHTGWKYEYIPVAWQQGLDMLRSGEIDLLMPAEYSEERAQDYIFSEIECCTDYTALVGRDDANLYYEDFASFDGGVVGLIEGNFLNEMYDRYAETNGFVMQKRYYKSGAELTDALASGEVDAVVNGNFNFRRDQKLLGRINYMPAYFITGKQNAPLMAQLNDALNQIKLQNPYYVANLHYKYYGSIEKQSVGFTRAEAMLIASSPPLRVLVSADEGLLMCYDKKNGAAGIYVEIARLIERESGLSFSFVPWDGEESPASLIESGEIDLLLDAERFAGSIPSVIYSDMYYQTGASLLGRRDVILDFNEPLKVAVSAGDPGHRELLMRRTPKWETIVCESREQCMEQVIGGTADIALVNSALLKSTSFAETYSRLMVIFDEPLYADVAFGMSMNRDDMLMSVINKTINKLEQADIQQCVLAATIKNREPVSLLYLMRTYPAQTLCVIAVTMLLLAIILLLVLRNYMHKSHNRLLEEKNAQLRDAAEQQRQMRFRMERDDLTGLKNKQAMQEICTSRLAQHADLLNAVMVLDVDNFKQTNDSHGHLYGDKVLAGVGKLLSKFNGEDCIAGRIGGDEFTVAICGLESADEAQRICEELLEDFHALQIEATDIRVTASIGMAIGICNSYQTLFEKADRALYQVKRNGKNSFLVVQMGNEA